MKKYSTPMFDGDVKEEVTQEDQKSNGNYDINIERIKIEDQRGHESP